MGALATSAKGVATRRELLDAGISSDQIKHRLATGALIRKHQGVYLVGHQAPSVQASYLAAVKACGEGALLSGLAAAQLYGLIKGAPPPEVTAPAQRRLDGVVTHRARAGIHPRDATQYDGIPVTTVPRTLVDIAPKLTPEALARAAHQAAARFRTRGDTPALLSQLERAFNALLRKHGLPLPQTNRNYDGEQDHRRERDARARGHG
jgi:predicted transcriptional regulator of viral defense system